MLCFTWLLFPNSKPPLTVQGYSESLQLYSKGFTMKSCKLFEYPCNFSKFAGCIHQSFDAKERSIQSCCPSLPLWPFQPPEFWFNRIWVEMLTSKQNLISDPITGDLWFLKGGTETIFMFKSIASASLFPEVIWTHFPNLHWKRNLLIPHKYR